MMRRPKLEVSHLPTVVFGPRSTLWFGFVGVIIVEGMMILFLIVSYLYLWARAADWPALAAPPPLAAGLVNTGVFLISIVPAAWLKRAARRGDPARVRALLLALSAVAVITIGVTGWAFASLNSPMDSHAYGSTVWMLLAMFALALIAAALVLWALAASFMRKDMVEGRRLMNAYEAGDYWLLAVVLWLATWTVIYVAPRMA